MPTEREQVDADIAELLALLKKLGEDLEAERGEPDSERFLEIQLAIEQSTAQVVHLQKRRSYLVKTETDTAGTITPKPAVTQEGEPLTHWDDTDWVVRK